MACTLPSAMPFISVTGSTFVSSIDFNSGYHQIPCTDNCKPLLAFSPGYGFGQWTWTVMPQGIKPASNHFQKTMEQTFSDLSDCNLQPFFDDVVIKGRSFQEHLCNIRRVLTRLWDAGLTLNALKVPGHGSICDRFLPHYSEIASPLHHLTEINAPFHWTPERDTAFNTIKHLLTNAPLVRAPDSRDFFILETDASDKGEGFCLKAHSYADGKASSLMQVANSTSRKPSGTSLKKKHTQSSLPLRSFAITFLESHSCSALTIVLTPTFNQNDRQKAENFSTGPLNYPNSTTKSNIFHQRTMQSATVLVVCIQLILSTWIFNQSSTMKNLLNTNQRTLPYVRQKSIFYQRNNLISVDWVLSKDTVNISPFLPKVSCNGNPIQSFQSNYVQRSFESVTIMLDLDILG
eukprot:gene899-199_t